MLISQDRPHGRCGRAPPCGSIFSVPHTPNLQLPARVQTVSPSGAPPAGAPPAETAHAQDGRTPPADTPRTRAPRLAIAAVAVGAFAVEMAVSARYGYHRDELYFLQAGQHPSFGYVDQPPLTPLTARLASEIFGGSLAGLRLFPALLLAVLTVLTAAMSRIAGAGRTGQVLAALATATCGEYLAAMHLVTTTTLDFAFWSLMLLFVMRLISSQNPRWWIAVGACVGAASEAKWTVGMLAAAVIAGFLLTPARSLLRSRFLLVGALIAAAAAAPDVIWQAMHGWPNLAVFQVLSQQAGHNRAVYWPAQILYTGFVLTPVWIAGLAWCLRSRAGQRFQPLGIAAALALFAFFVLGGKPYYAGGVYTFLFAAGSVPLEQWLSRGREAAAGRDVVRLAGGTAALVTGLALCTAVALLVALPMLPARALHSVPLQKINYDLGETIAWPRLVALVAREYRALPPDQRAAATILAGNYGEAGAIARYGPADGLPAVYSGANNFWYWGPPPARARSAIAVNIDPALLRRLFSSVRQITVFHNGIGVADDEQGVPVYVVTGLKTSWARAWPLLRDFS